MRRPFELMFVNASSVQRTVCVHFTLEACDLPGIRSLAWLVARAAPTTVVAFRWCLEYAFTWAYTGLLTPGTLFTPVQVWPAGGWRGNEVTLTSLRGRHSFAAQKHGTDRDSLTIVQDAAVVADAVSVGIGIDALPAFAFQARPRTKSSVPTASLACRVAVGEFVQGEVLDTRSLSHSALVPLTTESPSITATLGAKLRWTIAPTA